MHQSPKPSGGTADPNAAYAGAGTPQHFPSITQQDSSSSSQQVPPDLNLPLTGSNGVDGEASQPSTAVTPARGVSGTPGVVHNRSIAAPSPLRSSQATPSTRSYSVTKKSMTDTPVTPALPTGSRVRTPPQSTDVSPEQLSSQSHDSMRQEVVLGVQALEHHNRSKQEPHRVAAPTTQTTPSVPYPHTHAQYEQDNPFEDDEDTEPSSVTGSNEVMEPEYSNNRDRANSIGRLIRSTRKRRSSRDRSHGARREIPEALDSYDSDEDAWGEGSRPIIYGYLHKLGRNGKWQRRFFETDGQRLSYYKSSNRTKLLATLDLCKVGDIIIDSTDPTGCTFTIQVSDRPYSLRALNSSACKDWVITLNRIKEARMHIGNVELVSPKFHPPPDLLDRKRTESEEYAAYIVVNANRQRTRAVDENIKSWDQLVEKTPDFLSNSPVTVTQPGISPERPPKRIASHLPPKVMARWQKRRSLVYKMGRRIVRWARRMRKLRCMDSQDDVQLDRRVHPPGHNDPEPPFYAQKTVTVKSKDSSDRSKVSADSGASIGSGSVSPTHRTTDTMSHTEWIGKETQIVAQSIGGEEKDGEDEDSDKEARELS